MNKDTIQKLINYCEEHGLDFDVLPSIINEPKVVPMVRGIGYEYVVVESLKKIFRDDKRFTAGKTIVNAQLTNKGSDADIYDNELNKIIRIECKLASTKSFKELTKSINYPHCKIKVMRSRTLGAEMIDRQSKKMGISKKYLSAHKDSYTASDFDYVVTNIRNAFYITENNLFKFSPNKIEWEFLENFFEVKDHKIIDEKLKNTHFFISSKKLTPKFSGIGCNRRDCPNIDDCDFIPNYPIFNLKTLDQWRPLSEIRDYLIKG